MVGIVNLRQLAKECPHCMSCGLENPNGDLLCLAHSNALEDGRGAYHKSKDLYGAFLCHRCHDNVDGRAEGWGKALKRIKHREAWIETMRWLIDNDHLEVK